MSYEDRIVLGSGTMYCSEFNGTIPEDAVIETEENILGYISGGASCVYKTKYGDAVDDTGKRRKTILTDEEASLKTGLITWNGHTLLKLCATARVSSANGKRKIKIGGKANDNGKKYLLRFLHEDAEDGNCRLTIVGKNTSGFTLAYDPEKPTQPDAEFVALPSDAEGTLIIYDEDIICGLSVVSVAGEETGKTVLALAPNITTGHTYVYKTAASVEVPDKGDDLSSWTDWDGAAEITATTGHKIAVAEVDSSAKCVHCGITTVTSLAIS